MSLAKIYAPQYGLVCLLIVWLILTIQFRRRRERRLASGWKLVEAKSSVVKALNGLSKVFYSYYLGGVIVYLFQISPWYFLLLAFALELFTTREKWVAPKSATEPETGTEP